MDALPEWPDGTVAVLSTGAGAPHGIPVSTIVRRDASTIVFALALTRESLTRLRADERCALTVFAEDAAFTAYGVASIEELSRVARVTVAVSEIVDHRRDTFVIDAGVRWHWTDEEAERTDAAVRAQL
jgi:hypothetical protein